MADYVLTKIPKFGSNAWMVEWLLTSSDRTGKWFEDAPNSDISVEIMGITWSSAVVALQGTNRHNIMAFTGGGTTEIKPGVTITGATSGETAKVVAVRLNTTGTWGAGTAAGYLYVTSVSGAFTASENITVPGGTDDATLSADDQPSHGTDEHILNDVEGVAILYGTGNDLIYQIQENVHKIRPYLSTAGTNAFVRVTLYFSRPVTVIEARS